MPQTLTESSQARLTGWPGIPLLSPIDSESYRGLAPCDPTGEGRGGKDSTRVAASRRLGAERFRTRRPRESGTQSINGRGRCFRSMMGVGRGNENEE